MKLESIKLAYGLGRGAQREGRRVKDDSGLLAAGRVVPLTEMGKPARETTVNKDGNQAWLLDCIYIQF